MTKLLTLFIFGALAGAQDVTSVLAVINAMRNPPPQALVFTASEGDGSSIVLNKIPGTFNNLTVSMTGPSGSSRAPIIVAGGANANPVYYLAMWGDALCSFIANPTPSTIAAVGSWSAIPPGQVGYQCTSQIRSGGLITGNTALVAGVIP